MGNVQAHTSKYTRIIRCGPFILSISHCNLVHNLFILTNVYPSITTLQAHRVVRKWYFHIGYNLRKTPSAECSTVYETFIIMFSLFEDPGSILLFKKMKKFRTIPSGSAINGAPVLPDAVCSSGRKRTSAVLRLSSRKSFNLLLWLKMDAPNCIGCWFKITSAVYITSDLFYLLAHYGYE